ncbi:MAG: hypothetical protein ACRDE8_04930, partial [Ginsengibacter sp.]
ELIQAQKVKSKLTPLLWQRVVEIILHIIVIFWLIGFLYKNLLQFPYAVSAIALIAFYIIAFINCVRQIIIIKQMDYSSDIVTIQSSLVMLRTHIVDYMRLTFLCIPTYLAYPIIAFKALTNFDIVSRLQGSWWAGQIIFSIILIPVCIWLYNQVSYKNIHKKWVKYIIQKSSGTRVAKAMEFIRELEILKSDHI